MRQLTAKERESYGLPPLPEDQQAQIEAARVAKLQKAAESGNLQVGMDASGREIMRVVGQVAGINKGDVEAAKGAGPVQGGVNPMVAGGLRPDESKFADPTYESNRKMLAAALAKRAAQGGAAMSGAKMNLAANNEIRSKQIDQIGNLTAQAAGSAVPSAARATLQAGSDMASKNAMSLARSGRGSPGMAMKDAMDTQATIGQQTANSATMLAAQEQQTAQGRLMDALSGTRGQDIGVATTQAGLDQDTQKSNLAAALQEKESVDKMTQYYTSLGLGLDAAQAAAKQEYERLRVESVLRNRAADVGQFQAQTQRDSNTAQLVSSLFGSAANAAGMAMKG
jgi:hypothetical protein